LRKTHLKNKFFPKNKTDMKTMRPAADTGSDLAKAVLLAVVIALFLMVLMPATMLWDRDETLYARTAVEMLGSGNFIEPTFNGEVFAHKPPMIYWLMALSFAIFGENEFAARFISAPALAGSAFVTYLIGRRIYDFRVGLWATSGIALGHRLQLLLGQAPAVLP
jgi:4-amino-4-deoxy-L-arabinose transferase-like glycosyltransferase